MLQYRRGTTDERLSIIPLDGEPIWDTTNQKLYVGDGQVHGGIAVDSFFGNAPEAGSTHNITIVDTSNNLVVDTSTATFHGTLKGNLIGTDSSIIVDHNNSEINVVTGNINKVTGDLYGSVYSEDTTRQIVDAASKKISVLEADIHTIQLTTLSGNNSEIDIIGGIAQGQPGTRARMNLEAQNERAIFKFRKKNTAADLTGDTDPYGGIYFEKNDSMDT